MLLLNHRYPCEIGKSYELRCDLYINDKNIESPGVSSSFQNEIRKNTTITLESSLKSQFELSYNSVYNFVPSKAGEDVFSCKAEYNGDIVYAQPITITMYEPAPFHCQTVKESNTNSDWYAKTPDDVSQKKVGDPIYVYVMSQEGVTIDIDYETSENIRFTGSGHSGSGIDNGIWRFAIDSVGESFIKIKDSISQYEVTIAFTVVE